MKKRIMDKVERALIDQIGVKPGDGIVVGVSGGADSVSLLKVIQDLSIKFGLSVYAAHYNHGIRGGERRRGFALCSRALRLFERAAHCRARRRAGTCRRAWPNVGAGCPRA